VEVAMVAVKACLVYEGLKIESPEWALQAAAAGA